MKPKSGGLNTTSHTGTNPRSRERGAGEDVMTWVKLDDGFADHPKLLRAGPMAKALFVDGLCYAARQLTDGFLPEGQVKMLLVNGYPKATVDRLIDVGLWESVDGGFQIHDYLEYQPSSSHVSATRATRADAGRRGGQASKSEANSKQNAPGLLEHILTPARPGPAPTRPVPEEHTTYTSVEPDWYTTLSEIPGFSFSFEHCQAWLDEKGISVERADEVAFSVKSKWPGPKSRPYTDPWATFQSWVKRPALHGDHPAEPDPRDDRALQEIASYDFEGAAEARRARSEHERELREAEEKP